MVWASILVELEEFSHLLHWQGRHSVMLRLVVVNFVDWDGGVDMFSVVCLLVDDGLDGLVDMMMYMFSNDGSSFLC